MNRIIILTLLLFLYHGNTFSQAQSDSSKLEVLFTVGFSMQSFTDVFLHNIKHDQILQSIFLSGEANASGLGLPLNLKLYSRSRNTGIIYEPVIRYDVVDISQNFSNLVRGKPKKREIFFDHHISIYRKFKFSRKAKERNHQMGIGYSFISPGLSFDYHWEIINFTTGQVTTGSKVYLALQGFHFLYGTKVYKRFYAEGKIMYIPRNRIMYQYDQPAMIFWLKAAYQFRIK